MNIDIKCKKKMYISNYYLFSKNNKNNISHCYFLFTIYDILYGISKSIQITTC